MVLDGAQRTLRVRNLSHDSVRISTQDIVLNYNYFFNLKDFSKNYSSNKIQKLTLFRNFESLRTETIKLKSV